MKEEFENKVRELIGEKALEACLMSDERYEEVLQNTKEAKERKKNGLSLMPRDYRRLKRFDVISMGCIENLISARPSPDLQIRYFCRIGEMYEILATAHHKLGHKKEKSMEIEIKKKYCNITREVINVYLDMCETCALKKKEREVIYTLKQKAREACALKRKEKAKNRALKIKERAVNSVLEEKGKGNAVEPELNSRCQVDVINMESEPDGEYKFILNYQDYSTKFVVLRPLKTETPDEVVDVISDIFCLLGAPNILHSDNDQEFCKEVLEALAVQWKGVTLVQGRPQSEPQVISVDLTNQDVRDSLTAWMSDNNSSKWVSGLRFVQMSKNCTYHAGIKKTPHEALFRVPQKNNLFHTLLPISVAQVIKTEELEDNFPDITHISEEVTVTDAIKVENDSSEENDSEIVSSPMDEDQWYPKILYPEVKITPD